MKNGLKMAFFGRLASSSVRILARVATSSNIYGIANNSEITFTGGGLDMCQIYVMTMSVWLNRVGGSDPPALI